MAWVLLAAVLLTLSYPGNSVDAKGPEVSLYSVREPVFFDINAATVPIGLVPVQFGGERSPVVKLTADLGGISVVQEGVWLPATPAAAYLDHDEFSRAWSAVARPGVLTAEEKDTAVEAKDLLEQAGILPIELNLPVPTGAKAGDAFQAEVIAALKNGGSARTSIQLVATAWTTPAGWVIGDCHIHSSVGSHGSKSKAQIRTMAIARGHQFTYLTDHLDLIRSYGGWSSHWTGCQTVSTSTYTMAPGLEVSAAGGSGDALGYGMPQADPTELSNLTYDCATLVSRLQGTAGSGRTAAVAHPAGPTPWTTHGCGYNGCQVVNDEFANSAVSYWRHDIASHLSSGRSSAMGGSDYHGLLQSFGEATWVYAPQWQTASVWPGKKDKIAEAINLGRTVATDEGSLGFLLMDGFYPGGTFTRTAGTTVYYDIRAHAIDNGYSVRVSWDFYRGSSRINYGVSGILPSGAVFSVNGLATTVQSGTYGYSLVTRFDYLLDGVVQWTDMSHCGPTLGKSN
jgi:hypothetical protein